MTTSQLDCSPFLRVLALTATALAFAPGLGCSGEGPVDPDAELDAVGEEPATPRLAGAPCVSYCESKEGSLREKCDQEEDSEKAELCHSVVTAHIGACMVEQCGLVVSIPDPDELQELARQLGHTLLGPDYEVTDVIERYWGPNTVGSRAYVFVSSSDETRGFVEMGATLEQPPVVSYGKGDLADTTAHERAVARLTQYYGEGDYALSRAFFTSMFPVLEYVSEQGTFYYDVSTDDVSDTFEISENPDVDQAALDIQREGYARQWDRYLSGQFE